MFQRGSSQPFNFSVRRQATIAMPRYRTPVDSAAGKLVLAVQKVLGSQWHDMERYYFAEAVMNRAHNLHQAVIQSRLHDVLADRTIGEYLDAGWVASDPGVEAAISALHSSLNV
jgi:hypothetical protein